MTTGHLDPSVLAEHAEGLLEPADAAAVEAHLRTCQTCQATVSELASVSAMLAAAPASLPAPPDVGARLERALTAEAAAGGPEPAPVIEMSWFRRRAPQLLAAAATVGVLGFAGWVVSSGTGGDDDSATDAGASLETTDRDDSAGDGSADEPADAGGDAADEEAAEEEAASAPMLAEDGAAEVPTAELEDEIRAITEQARAAEGDDSGERLDACGQPLADEWGTDLVGSATTELTGEPAVLIVLDSDEPGFVDGWVLPGCDALSDEAITLRTVEVD